MLRGLSGGISVCASRAFSRLACTCTPASTFRLLTGASERPNACSMSRRETYALSTELHQFLVCVLALGAQSEETVFRVISRLVLGVLVLDGR